MSGKLEKERPTRPEMPIRNLGLPVGERAGEYCRGAWGRVAVPEGAAVVSDALPDDAADVGHRGGVGHDGRGYLKFNVH
eukprot:3037585-Pyramimonas_sp.AAC.1